MTRTLAALLVIVLLVSCSAEPSPTAVPSLESGMGSTSAPPSPAQAKPTSISAATTGAPKPSPTGPRIEYFRIKAKPSCPSSGPGASFPGNPIVLEWKVAGVTEVTISIDGPGIFGTYDATYEDEFPFSCSGNSGTTQQHTYVLRARLGGSNLESTLTGEARVN